MSLWPQQLVEMMPTIQVRGRSHLLGIDANDSGGDRFTNTGGACDVSHLSCVHGGVQDSDGDRFTNTCPMWIFSEVLEAHSEAVFNKCLRRRPKTQRVPATGGVRVAS